MFFGYLPPGLCSPHLGGGGVRPETKIGLQREAIPAS